MAADHRPSNASSQKSSNVSDVIETIEFSVVDVETTGLFPEYNDRIIEIAVVRVNFAGQVVDQYSTLVNPGRDLGPTHIHRISARDVKDAPIFREIAGDVMLRLGGAFFAGFNPGFDFRFLRSEMHRIGHELPDTHPLCVMQLAGSVAPDLPGRNLQVCCKHFGIPLVGAHSAHDDAAATGKLLGECLKRTKPNSVTLLQRLGIEPLPEKARLWPDLPISGKSYTRTQAAEATESQVSYIERLVASLPAAVSVNPKLDAYLPLLDRVLEDRLVTADEANMLFSLAQGLGISQDQARKAHCQYMRDLIKVALADGVISDREEQDLQQVGRLLSIPGQMFEQLVREVKTEAPNRLIASHLRATAAENFAGMTICFTGTFTCRIKGEPLSRGFAETIAQQRGMTVRKGVTKDLDILVVADPESMSGKAKKARQYGIRIVAEPAFWRIMGIDFE